MHMRFTLRGLALYLILAALSESTAFGQQKYRLRDDDAVGDLSVTESSLSLRMDIQATANGQKSPTFQLANQGQEKYAQTVLALGKNRQPSAIRRTYTVARTVETEPGKSPQRKTLSVEGKTVTIRKSGGKVVVTVAKGKISAEDRKDLLDELEASEEEFFPKRDVAPGDTWTINSKQLAKAFGGAGRGTVRGRFIEVVSYAGRRCARIQIDLEVTTKAPGVPILMKLNLSGDAYHALDIQRTLAVTLAGPVTAKGQAREQGMTILFSGNGTVQMKMTADWQKVGGKPTQ